LNSAQGDIALPGAKAWNDLQPEHFTKGLRTTLMTGKAEVGVVTQIHMEGNFDITAFTRLTKPLAKRKA